MTERWPCVTARCIREDLEAEPPNPQIARRCDIGLPIVDKLKTIAPQTPVNQKPVSSLQAAGLQAFRIRSGQYRGCTWHDGNQDVVWLLAAKLRRAGDRNDAFEQFQDLHNAGLLVPTRADRAIVALERLFHAEAVALGDEIADTISEALLAPDTTFHLRETTIDVPVRVMVEAVEVGDGEGLADIVVAFYHSDAFPIETATIVHVIALKRAAERMSLPPPEQWEIARGFQHFPQARTTYVVTTEISLN